MRQKASIRTKIRRVLKASVIVLAIFNVLIWYGVLTVGVSVPAAQESVGVSMSADISPDGPAPAVQESVGVPVRIKILSIALDAAIEKVALTADGAMGVPGQPLDAAWYELGPRPGETGSAAIAGHVDWVNGDSAAFANLHQARSGDKIEVLDDTGSVISFVVRESRKYDSAADATDVFTSNDGKSHLNLITCAGTWNKRAKQYSERLVVFADKVAE